MNPVSVITGRAAPLPRGDIDTDQIVPSDALKNIGRAGFGKYLFMEWREDPSFVLNQPQYQGVKILIAGPNFGCGSSREHAPWALQDFGFEAVIAAGFADIFKNNCTKIGLVTVELPEADVRRLLEMVQADPGTEITVDLRELRVSAPGYEGSFEVDEFTRYRLLNGLDDIGLTLRSEDLITQFEGRRSALLPSQASE